jgi:hypothetical protein
MAGETIDGMIATAMTADDKAARKRHRLTGLKSLAAFALTAGRRVGRLTAAINNQA